MKLFYVVPQAHCAIVERLGKFSRVWGPGLHMRFPWIERVKDVVEDCEWFVNYTDEKGNTKRRFIACRQAKVSPVADAWCSYIELSDQRLNTNPRNYHTKDNVPVEIDAVIFWRITKPEDAVYNVDGLVASLIDQSLNSLRSCIGNRELDRLLSDREELSREVTEKVAAVANRWGIAIQRVEIQELKTDDNVAEAMRKEMSAEREKRAAILSAEAEAQSAVLTAEAQRKAAIISAEGEKEAAILRAEGEFRAKELLAQADSLYIEKVAAAGNIKSEDIIKVLVAQKYIDGFDAISKNPSDKVFLPNSAGSLNLFVGENKDK